MLILVVDPIQLYHIRDGLRQILPIRGGASSKVTFGDSSLREQAIAISKRMEQIVGP